MTERKILMPKLSLWLVRLIASHQVQTRVVQDPMLFASWYAMGSDLLDWPDEARAIKRDSYAQEATDTPTPSEGTKTPSKLVH